MISPLQRAPDAPGSSALLSVSHPATHPQWFSIGCEHAALAGAPLSTSGLHHRR